uniref:Uncharacterized protein n=1 Tax=Amphimedon queenslandica TaxID=400682 RepID=A0A1X7T2T2_AMPQE
MSYRIARNFCGPKFLRIARKWLLRILFLRIHLITLLINGCSSLLTRTMVDDDTKLYQDIRQDRITL